MRNSYRENIEELIRKGWVIQYKNLSQELPFVGKCFHKDLGEARDISEARDIQRRHEIQRELFRYLEANGWHLTEKGDWKRFLKSEK